MDAARHIERDMLLTGNQRYSVLPGRGNQRHAVGASAKFHHSVRAEKRAKSVLRVRA